ncbi:MAG: TIGR02281 family clan AA aspartic protease [Pseudomonadota bacterium]
MFFWPILLVGLLALAITLGGPPEWAMFQPGHPARLVYLTVFATGIVVGGALRILIFGGWRTWTNVGVWILAIGGLGLLTQHTNSIRYAIDRIHGEVMPSVAVSNTAGEVELRRTWDGHYRADTMVNGRNIRLLVDTGASLVLIPYEEAPSLGIDVEALEYSMPVTTANGRSTVAPIMLETVEIGPIRAYDVAAAVSHPGSLKSGLLGMSFLEQLDETSFQRDKLVLRQRARAGLFKPAPQLTRD